MTDLLVIGGGAAGLMAAGAACAKGLTVTVLEHNPKGPGQKLLITGKGRCNVTSDSDVREFLPYVRHNGRFLYSSLYAFPPASAMQLFEELGVPLKTERGRRVFPQSDRAADVLAALRDYARDAEFVHGSAKKLLLEDGVCKGAVTDRGETLRAENTLIATGGISYPATGSDGSGYKLARQAGHTIVTPQPSLCSLISPDPACRRMMGLALRNVRLTLLCDGKVQKLTTKECELLSLLCQHMNEILERNYALKSIWIDDNYFNARSMDVYITKLRKLLKDDPAVEIINIHGKGYKLIAPGDEE